MIKHISFLFFFFFASTLFADEIIPYENQQVQRIDINFTNDFAEIPQNAKPIIERMSTKKGDYFSQTKFDHDLKTLSHDFDRIDPKVESIDGMIYITLNIWVKPTIRSICFEGNIAFSSDVLSKELGILPNSLFDRIAFNRAFHKLKTFFVKKGFYEATLTYDIIKDPSTQGIDIKVNVNEGRSGKIRQIWFEGFTQVEKNEIVERMNTKLYNIFTGWFTNEGVYTEQAIKQDEYIIADYLHNKGFADATVKIEVHEIDANAIALKITAEKGPLYAVGTFSFQGNCVLAETKLRKALCLKENEPFSINQVRESVELMTSLYGQIGYIDAIVTFDLHLIPGTYIYNVHFAIEEANFYRVGLIKIFGNSCTQTRIILHEALLIPGEIFNTEKLKNTELRLMNTGYFKNVNVYSVKSAEARVLGPEYRDIHVEVEETGTGSFNLNLGLSTTEGIFGSVELTERNFNILGFRQIRKYGLRALRGAGEFFRLNGTIGTKNSSYTLSWIKPFIYDTPWTVGFDVVQSTNRYLSDDYNLRSVQSNVHATYDLNVFMRVGCHYRIKYSYDKSTGKPDDNEEKKKMIEQYKQQMKNDPYLKEANLRGVLSALGVHWQYDSTNSPVYPTKGFRSRLEAECAGFGGRFKFCSFGYLNSYFIPFKKLGFFRFKTDFRFLQPFGNTRYSTIPLDERLFLGDEYYVRGFRPYRLGPTFPDKKDAPRGGLTLEYFSAQYNHFLYRNIEGFVFFDAGGLSRQAWDVFTRVYMSVGIGARVQVIQSIPPIELGFGFPLNPQDRSQVKRFFLSIGGKF